MSDPISVVKRFITEYQTGGNEAAALECLAAEFVDHTPFPGFGSTRDDVLRLFSMLRGAFPDLRAEIHTQLADGDRVATSKTFHGTQQGPLIGMPPTGKTVAIQAIDLLRVKDGKMVEHWNVVDVAGLMGQLRS